MKAGTVEGGDYYHTEPYDTMLNSGTLAGLAFYLQDEWRILPGSLSLVGGIRFDLIAFREGSYYTNAPWNSNYPELSDQSWQAFSPRLQIQYSPSRKVMAYLGYSRGFRTAVLDDLTRTGFMLLGPKYANPGLGPESLNNIELGLRVAGDSSIVLDGAVFYSWGRDFHYYLASGDTIFGRPVYRKENLTGVEIRGFELSVSCRVFRGLTLDANYTFNQSRISRFTERPELEGKSLKYVPAHQAKAGIVYRSKLLSASLNGRFKSKQYTLDDNASEDARGNPAAIKAYFVADAALWKNWKKMVFKITMTNLFNEKYLDNPLYLAPGRMVGGSIGVSF
jgi:iron complex outermembrane receptor protein